MARSPASRQTFPRRGTGTAVRSGKAIPECRADAATRLQADILAMPDVENHPERGARNVRSAHPAFAHILSCLERCRPALLSSYRPVVASQALIAHADELL